MRDASGFQYRILKNVRPGPSFDSRPDRAGRLTEYVVFEKRTHEGSDLAGTLGEKRAAGGDTAAFAAVVRPRRK